MDLKKDSKKRNYCISFLNVLAIITILMLAVSPVTSADQQSPETKTIVDGAGNSVTIPTEVNSIVVIQGACNVPPLLSALGVGDELLQGVCFKSPMLLTVEPGYANIETSPAPNGEANVESLLKFNPDLVIGWTNLKNEQVIRDAGLPLVIEDLSTFDTTRKSTEMIAEAVGAPEIGQKILSSQDDAIKLVDEKVSGLSADQRKKVLLLSNSNPITVLGADSYNRDMIEKAGGICVTDNMPGYFVPTDMEQLLNLDPDIIMVTATGSQSYKDLMSNSTWDSLRAKKNGDIYLIPTGLFLWDKPGAENNLFLLWEANLFYPDLISADLVKDETRKFYADYFNHDLTDEEYDIILNGQKK